jgi:hypothetical protein
MWRVRVSTSNKRDAIYLSELCKIECNKLIFYVCFITLSRLDIDDEYCRISIQNLVE